MSTKFVEICFSKRDLKVLDYRQLRGEKTVKEFGAEIEEIIIQALGHEARRTMLKIINSSEKGASYTELMIELGLSTGKLNYHLRQLEGLVEKNKERRYLLTPLGRKATTLLSSITRNISSDEEKYLEAAQLAQKSILHPLVISPIYIGIAMVSVILGVWGYLTYIVVTERGPPIVYILLPILLAIGFALLGWLIYALKRAPEHLKRFEKRLFRLR